VTSASAGDAPVAVVTGASSGIGLADRRLHPTSPRLVNPDLAERLWQASAEAVGLSPR
jgi:NADP-dependent 3-hydroxy acid dehydrogenase YdfG